jgi:hypothetical protein
MQKDYLVLKRASASRPTGQWNDDDFDMLANGQELAEGVGVIEVARVRITDAGRRALERETAR